MAAVSSTSKIPESTRLTAPYFIAHMLTIATTKPTAPHEENHGRSRPLGRTGDIVLDAKRVADLLDLRIPDDPRGLYATIQHALLAAVEANNVPGWRLTRDATNRLRVRCTPTRDNTEPAAS